MTNNESNRIQQQQGLFNKVQNNLNNTCFGGFNNNNPYNNNNNSISNSSFACNPSTSNAETRNIQVKNILALELLRIINPFYLHRYFDIEKVDEKLFTYFLKESNPYYLTAMFYKNSNSNSSDNSIKHDYLIDIISKFINNILAKAIQGGNPEFEDLKMNFMQKIPNLLTLEQVEKIVLELDKSISTTNTIHRNFWYDLLLNKKFKNEISLSSEPIKPEEKYNVNLKILKFIKENNFSSSQTFKSFILLSLLKSNQELNSFNLDLFLEYIENPFFEDYSPNKVIYKQKQQTSNQAASNNIANSALNRVNRAGFGFGAQQQASAKTQTFRNLNIEFQTGFIFRINGINIVSEEYSILAAFGKKL